MSVPWDGSEANKEGMLESFTGETIAIHKDLEAFITASDTASRFALTRVGDYVLLIFANGRRADCSYTDNASHVIGGANFGLRSPQVVPDYCFRSLQRVDGLLGAKPTVE